MLIGADCYLLVGYFCLGDGGGSFSRLPPPPKKKRDCKQSVCKSRTSAPFSVQAARRAFVETCAWADSGGGGTCGTGVRGVAGLQPRFFRHQRDPAVVEHEAGNAGAAVASGVVEDGAAVAQAQELLEEANVRAYVDDFISLAPLGLPLDETAVGAAGHTVDLDHGKPI